MTTRNSKGRFVSEVEAIKDKAVADGLLLLNDQSMPSPVVRRLWAWNTLEAAAIKVARIEAGR